MTKVHYLTARCPQGCETWLHPAAVWPHTHEPGRCRRRPWVDDLADTALIAAPLAQDIAAHLPPGLVAKPEFSEDRLLAADPPDYLRIDLCAGIVVKSPLEGIRARRWAVVTGAAVREQGLAVIDEVLTADGFAALEAALVEQGRLEVCPDCGDTVTSRGLARHRARNTACRWRRAAAEVRRLWDDGWRDPRSVPGAPLKWMELNATMAWRRRIHVVPFPAWTAVLLRDGVRP